jgi:hypothetical protein
MGFNTNKISKSNFRAIITRKQAQFNRFVRRCSTTKNVIEKRFLKTEAARICKELNQFCKQWKNFGFGSTTWIKKNCTMGCFNTKTTTRRGRKTNIRKSSTRRYAKRGYSKRSYARRTTRTNSRRIGSKARRYGWSTRNHRTNKARRSYVAW